jgi:hypothetical protein
MKRVKRTLEDLQEDFEEWKRIYPFWKTDPLLQPARHELERLIQEAKTAKRKGRS